MSLQDSIEDHRAMMRSELDFNPTQRTPPVAYKWDRVQRAMVPDDSPLVINPLTPDQIEVPDSATQSTQVGMPMSGRLLRYLQGPSADTPWANAVFRLRAECRRKHPHHRGADVPYWRGSLCHELIRFTIIRGYSMQSTVEILRYDNPEPLLREAFRFIEQVIDAERAKAERRAREDEGHGPGAIPVDVPPHHSVDGLHREECPQCRRKEDVA